MAAKASVKDADAFRAALEAAEFKSVRGKFRFNTNHHPIQDFYVREVVKDARRRADEQDHRHELHRPRGRLRQGLQDVGSSVSTAFGERHAEVASWGGCGRAASHARRSAVSTQRRAFPTSAPTCDRTIVQTALLIEQLLNGLQFGVMLFLMAAGLTLIFGVMGLINLAHGSLYMVGAFACAAVAAATGSFWLGLVASLVARRRPAQSSKLRSSAGSTTAIISTRCWRLSR